MSIDAINNVGSNPMSAAGSARLPAKTLGQEDFLKLLVTQLSAQDPMNPQSNTDFAAQMAQFSALQTAQATQSDVSRLRVDQQVQQAYSLLGRAVTVQAGDGTVASGTVNGIQMNAGMPKLQVNGGSYDLSQVVSIQTTAPTAPASK